MKQYGVCVYFIMDTSSLNVAETKTEFKYPKKILTSLQIRLFSSNEISFKVNLFFNHPLDKLVVVSLIIVAHMGQIQVCKNTEHGGIFPDDSGNNIIFSNSLRDETSTSMK